MRIATLWEMKYGTPGNYAVDHFRPKSNPEFRKLVCRYSNLFYACRDCNLYKGSTWPSKYMRNLGFRFLDPCRVDMSVHWNANPDGSLMPASRAGEYMISRLWLHRQFLCDWRREKSELTDRINEIATLISSATLRGDTDEAGGLERLHDRLASDLLAPFGDFWR